MSIQKAIDLVKFLLGFYAIDDEVIIDNSIKIIYSSVKHQQVSVLMSE